MTQYYVVHSGAAAFVKEAGFFISQGGLTQEWGKRWKGPIEAESIHAARMRCFELFNIRPNDAQVYLSANHERHEKLYGALLKEREGG